MNTTSSGAKNQPKAVPLAPQQSELLMYFAAMTDEAQQCVIGMVASIAKGSPRQRPQLRLVVGGQA